MAAIRDLLEYLRIDVRSAYRTAWNGKHDATYEDITTPTAVGVTSSRNSLAIFTSKGFSTAVTWDRVDWQAWCQPNINLVSSGLLVTVAKAVTTRDLIQDLGRWLSFESLPADWILDEPVTLTKGGSVTFKSNEKRNLWWTGNLVLPVKTPCFTLADGTVVQEFDFNARPWHHPGAEGGIARPLFNAGVITHGVDYSAQDVALFAIPQRTNRWAWASPTAAQATALATALKAVDGMPWNTSATSTTVYADYNLLFCSIIYNGPVEGAQPYVDAGFAYMDYKYFEDNQLLRKDKEFVLIANLNPNQGSNNLRYAPLIVHYGKTIPKSHLEQPWKDPIHWWRFGPVDPWVDRIPNLDTTAVAADLTNIGSDEDHPLFPAVVDGFLSSGGIDCIRLKTAGSFPLAKPIPMGKEYTISFLHFHPETSRSTHYAFFGDGVTTTGWVSGPFTNNTFDYWMQPFTATSWVRTDGATGLYRNFSYVTFVVRDGRCKVYINGELIRSSLADTVVSDYVISHFGRGGQYSIPASNYMGEIAFFDYALNYQQVQKFFEATQQAPYKLYYDEPVQTTHDLLEQFNRSSGLRLTQASVVKSPLSAGQSNVVLEPTYQDPQFMQPKLVRLWNGAAAKNVPRPKYHLGHAQGNRNLGTSLCEFTLPLTRTLINDQLWYELSNNGPLAFGDSVTVALGKGWTFELDLLITEALSGDVVLFSTNQLANVTAKGSLILRDQVPMLVGITETLTAPPLAVGKAVNLKFYFDGGTLYFLYDNVPVAELSLPQVERIYWRGVRDSSPNHQFPATIKFKELKYWDIPANAPIAPRALYHWMADGSFKNKGTAAGADLATDQFTPVEYQGETYAAIAQPYFGKLPAGLTQNTDYTLDVWIVASKIPGDEYGLIFAKANNSSTGAVGDLFTWRNITNEANNVPGFTGMGYSSQADCTWRPGFDDTPVRFTIVRTGNVYNGYRNGVLVWTFTSTTVAGAWWYFGSNPKRDKQYFRDLRYYDRALSATELDTLFSS